MSNAPVICCTGVVLGDSGTGKTSILLRWARNTFETAYAPTLGVDYQARTVYIDERAVRPRMWDTAGQERFHAIVPLYVRECNLAIVVVDVTSRTSLDNARSWIDIVKREQGDTVPIYLVGNKIDREDRVITTEELAERAAELGVTHFECSAKDGTNVKKLFTAICTEYADKYAAKQPAAPETVDTSDVRVDTPLPERKGGICPC